MQFLSKSLILREVGYSTSMVHLRLLPDPLLPLTLGTEMPSWGLQECPGIGDGLRRYSHSSPVQPVQHRRRYLRIKASSCRTMYSEI